VSDHGGAICAVSDGGYAVTGSSDGNVLLAKLDKNGDTINLGETDLTISVPGTTGSIKFDNAIEVAASAVSGLTKPRQLGSTALDLLIDTLNGVTTFCSNGSYTFAPVPTAPLTTGTSTLTFTNCVTGPTGDQSTINGNAVLEVGQVLGSPLSLASNYTVQMTLTSINLTIVDTVGTSTIAGGMRFQRVASGGTFTELAQSIDAQKFTSSESSATKNRKQVIGPFTVSATITSTSFSLGATTDTLTVDSGLGPLAVTVSQPVQGGAIGTTPTTGTFRVVAPDSSQLTVTVTNGVAVSAVETNGDGSVDGTISASWDVLD
jgi:hypothetical protein